MERSYERRLSRRNHLSVIEEASVHYVCDGGNGRKHRRRRQERSLGLITQGRACVLGWLLQGRKGIARGWIRLKNLVWFKNLNRALARGTQHLGSGKCLGGTSLKRTAWFTIEVLGSHLARVPRWAPERPFKSLFCCIFIIRPLASLWFNYTCTY